MTRVTSRTGNDWRENQGFALIELVAAMAILALLSAVAIPRWTQSSKADDLRTAAVDIAMLLRADRNAARRSGADVLTTVDMERRLVRSGTGAASAGWPDHVDVQFLHSSRRQQSRGGAILFSPDGRSSGGAFSFQSATESYRIVVAAATARVSLSSRDRLGLEAQP